MSGYLPLALIYFIWGVVLLDSLFFLLSVFNFVLHEKRLHHLSFYISCIYGVIYFSLETIYYDLDSNLLFFLLVMCMIAIVLFDSMYFLKFFIASATVAFFVISL